MDPTQWSGSAVPSRDPGRPSDHLSGARRRAPGTAAVDPAPLDRLALDLGGADAAAEVLSDYLDLLPERLAATRTLMAADERRRLVHTLKSGARLLGGHALAELAEGMEHAASQGLAWTPRQLSALEQAAADATDEWARWRSSVAQ